MNILFSSIIIEWFFLFDNWLIVLYLYSTIPSHQ